MYPLEFLLLNIQFGYTVARPMRSPDNSGLLKIPKETPDCQVVLCKRSFEPDCRRGSWPFKPGVSRVIRGGLTKEVTFQLRLE